MSPNVTFLLKLRKMDKARMSVRDVLVLYTIMAQPGINGNDVTFAIGHKHRSALQSAFARLIQYGFIEDRRTRVDHAVPTNFHALPAGRKFWDDLVNT